MTRVPFVMFGPAHLAALVLSFLLPLVLAAFVRVRCPSSLEGGPARLGHPVDRTVRWGLAAFLLCGWIGWYALFGLRGWLTVGNGLPLNLCDWASFALIVALIRPNPLAYELGYFWGLGGTLQGVATPGISFGFPDPQFIFFFIEHGGIIAALLYLTLGTGLRPTLGSLPRVVVASLFYAAVAGLADWLLGVDYGFLRAKPDNVSLLSVMSPWPWYIPELIAAGLLSLMIYYLPFAFADRLRRR